LPNIKSAEKRMRLSEKQRKRNKTRKTRVKTAIRKFNDSLEGDDQEAAEERLSEAFKALDNAVAKGVLQKNNAARKKSKLHKKFNEKFAG